MAHTLTPKGVFIIGLLFALGNVLHEQESSSHAWAQTRVDKESLRPFPFFFGETTYFEGKDKDSGEPAIRVFQKAGVALIKVKPTADLSQKLNTSLNGKQVWLVTDLSLADKIKHGVDPLLAYAVVQPVAAVLTNASLSAHGLRKPESFVVEAWTIMSPTIKDPNKIVERDTWLVDSTLKPCGVIRGKSFYKLRPATQKEKELVDKALRAREQVVQGTKVPATTANVFDHYEYDPKTRTIGPFQSTEIW